MIALSECLGEQQLKKLNCVPWREWKTESVDNPIVVTHTQQLPWVTTAVTWVCADLALSVCSPGKVHMVSKWSLHGLGAFPFLLKFRPIFDSCVHVEEDSYYIRLKILSAREKKGILVKGVQPGNETVLWVDGGKIKRKTNKQKLFLSVFLLWGAKGGLWLFAIQISDLLNIFKAAVKTLEGAPTSSNDLFHYKKKGPSGLTPSQL